MRRSVNRLIRKYDHTSQVRDIARDSIEERGAATNTYAVQTAATPAQTNSAGISQDGTDFSYFAQVQFGSADTPLYMLLDTGASTTWVMGPSCGSAACKGHNSFGLGDSTTFQMGTESFYVAYGAGNVSGTLGSDSISLAGMKFQMTFGIANNTSNDFEYFPIDGILGLSLDKPSTPSFLDTLVSSKAIKSNVFGISLNRASDGGNTGEINFGAPDASKFAGTLNYTPVTSNGAGDWAIPLANVGFGSNQAGITGKLAYIDTGTSFIFCPPDQAAAFYAIVPGAKIASTGATDTYSVPCGTTTVLTFTFGTTTYSVSPKDWISSSVNGVCTGNVFGRTIVPDAWLLGDTFLKNVYAVFDVDQTRVGLAAAIVAASSSTTSASGSSSSATGSAGQATPATVTGSSDAPTMTTPGISGHQTSGSSGTAAAETSASSATPTKNAGAARYHSSHFGLVLPALAFVLL